MDFLKATLALFLSLLLTSAYAAIDPVSWSVSPAGFPPNTVNGNSYSVTFTFTNNLPRPVPFDVSSVFDGGSFSVTHGCKTTLAGKNQPNSSCLLHLQFQPSSPGLNTAKLSMLYHNNVVPLPTLSSTSTGTVGSIQGFVSTPLPGVTYTGVTYPVQFTYVNHGTVPVTATAVVPSGFNPNPANGCTAAIPVGGSCTVSGTFTPVSVGQTSLGVTYYYNDGSTSRSVPLVTQTVVKNGAGCHQINGMAVLPLPDKTYIYADNVVKYEFTNFCPSTESLGTVSLASDGTATLTKGTDTCSGATLAQSQSCSVYVSVVPTVTAADLTVSASISYQGGSLSASAHTSEEVQALTQTDSKHTVMFVNQCDFPVWYEFSNGSGTSADPTPANARTFADYQINRQVRGNSPYIKVLMVDQYLNGAIYARTGCDATTGVCQTANCPVIAGTATCQLGVQPVPPQTKFELNMGTAGNDGIYDVSVINGFNVPGEVRSLAPVNSGPPPPGNIKFPFNCGQSTGALIQPANTALGACPWTFSPPSTAPDAPANYIWVTGGSPGVNCTQNSDCALSPLGKYCGMTSPDPVDGKIYRSCGNFLGYYTLADYIGLTAPGQWDPAYDLYALYGMGNPLQPQGTGPTDYGNFGGAAATVAAMYGCQTTTTNALNTGYNTQAQNNDKVCGCYNWNDSQSLAYTPQVTDCTGHNIQWHGTVFPRILWLKQACPTAYSFQFDDKSTQWQCNTSGVKTSYQITFCPGGKTGKPAS
ncbi:thaumatin family protein [Legionella quateirensis]|uniref:Thaumatin domain-containing protein n=1 Tax=Legionella quateirensis TaxID=45072 RepID=A0A378KTD3_9GAMM|nr:thaumatin family protein [Legionella quateirensis]KTD44621.1 Thaumatin domain-containing protein [Legionella quateirensis]STY16861.1 Thaumatin domain-containing protein [Legionella quateirensis]